MFYIPQIQNDDCGYACLKMVLANINKDKNYLFLPQDEEFGQYSYSDLTKIAKKQGLNFTAFKVEEKLEINNCISFPLIVTIQLKNGANHAIVITKIKWKHVYYIDPRRGSGSMSLKKFTAIWDGTGLMIDSFEKKKCDITPVQPVKAGSKIGLSIIQLIAGVFAVLGVYFIKDDTPIYIPVIFLSLAIVCELIMRAFTFSIMKRLDRFFFSDNNIPKKGYREYLYRFENYKRLSLSSPMNLILLAVFAVGLGAVVILNDMRNAMLVLVPVVIAAFDVLVVKPMLKEKKVEVIELEDNLERATDGGDLQSKVKEMHNKSYNYSYIDIASRYIYVGLLLLTALLTMRLCGLSSFPYIIFYTCIGASILKALIELFSFNERIEQFNVAKVKIINSIHNKH